MVLAASPGHASSIASVEEALKEKVYGDPDAPVTVVEYASLGCPHCANFHLQTFPELKKTYIDTGKVRLVYKDFPLGRPAFAASMIARCAGHERYFGMIDVFYKSQANWSRAENPLAELQKVARFGGLSPEGVEACLGTRPLAEGIQKVAKEAQKIGVNSTPSFVIEGRVYPGAMSFEEMKPLIDGALERAGVK